MNICVLYGGRSGEHEASFKSAASVVKNLEPSKYRVTTIGIDKAGRRHLCCVWQAGHRLRVPRAAWRLWGRRHYRATWSWLAAEALGSS